MRRLLPDPADLELDELYRDLELGTEPDGRSVYLGMVTSLDGRVTVDGVSGGLGGEADLVAFRRLRAAADAVLVGAGTVRAEDYRGVRLPEDVQAARLDAGRAAVPPVVVVTASLELDPDARLFHDTTCPPWLVVPRAASEASVEPFAERAEIVRCGHEAVDVAEAVDLLVGRGLRRILVEGGPSLNAQLLAAGVVDEVFVTITPVLVGEGPGLVTEALGSPVGLVVREVYEHDGELLLRLSVARRDA